MGSPPKVSIVTTFLDPPAGFFRDALDSVMAQTFGDWELLLVNDGSGDESSRIAEEYAGREPRIRLLHHAKRANRGMGASRNLAFHHARGDYVAFLDADDVWLPDKLERQVAVLDRWPEAGLTYWNTLSWYSWTGNPRDQGRDRLRKLGLPRDRLLYPPLPIVRFLEGDAAIPVIGSLLARRSAVEAVGGFEDEYAGLYEDQVFYARMMLSHPIVVTGGWEEKYRRHARATTKLTRSSGGTYEEHRKYIQWLNRYLSEQGWQGTQLWRLARRRLWYTRHRRMESVTDALRLARRRGARRIRRPFERRAAILLYHRVTHLDRDPWSLAVTPEHFDEQLRVLVDHYVPITLAELVRSLQEDDLPRGAVAVTFDDGYADNFEIALPRLRSASIPATLYLIAGAIGTEEELWWDELEAICLGPTLLPPTLDLPIGGDAFQFDLEDTAICEDMGPRKDEWRASRPPATPRQALYLALWRRLRALTTPVRGEAMTALRAWAGRAETPRPTHRVAVWDAVLNALADPLIELGAHTLGHPALSTLTAEEQRHEITAARVALEARIGAGRVASFSYPFGDHGRETRGIVDRAGYRYACAGRIDVVRPGTDRLLLPRLHVPDVGGAEFRRWLGRWL
jgi:glycosyltransferase involved in cell wall biosynthesis/peptidoglycan/xylan/chitin deacetylase (PgdA/CDA1 family)